MKTIKILSYFALLISFLLTVDYFLPKRVQDDLVLSRETLGGRDNGNRRSGNSSVRIIETLTSSFSSAEETEQCCVYEGDMIRLAKTMILRIPYSYRLKEDNYTKEYFPLMSYFYVENIGNYFMCVFALLSLYAKVIERRLLFFALAMFLLFYHAVCFVFYY